MLSRAALGRFAVRLTITTVGLLVFAVGIVLNLQSGLGLSPWQALHFGMTLHMPLTFGQASQIVGLLMIVASWVAGIRPGLATLMNTVLVGLFTDLLLATELIPKQEPGLSALAMLLLSLVLSGLGIAGYIRGGLGAGPRDSFMLALMRLTGRGAAPVRIAIEVGATLGGFLLGAPLGIGTVLFAIGLGPSIGIWFKLLGVESPAREPRSRRPPPPGPLSGVRPGWPTRGHATLERD